MNKIARNHGIDLLRILSMFGVILLHILNHGGVLHLTHSPARFSTVWFLEALSDPAVNCFMLISGYVGYRGEKAFPKIKNLLSLLFTVLFYSITIFFLFKLFGPDPLGMKALIKSFLPTMLNQYWFFTAYFGLFLISPVLNIFVHKSNLKQAFVFLIVFFLFSIVSTVYDSFSILRGYSVLWFIFMYLVGAIIKKYDLSRLFSKKIWLLIVLSALAVTWLSKIVLYFTNIPFLQSHSSELVKYVSPTIVIMSIGLLCLFAKIRCPSSLCSVISFVAPSAFSVYLIHDNVYIRMYLMSHMHKFADGFNAALIALFIVCSAAAIFLVCIIIDKIRTGLFALIRIDKLAAHIEDFLKANLNALYKKFQRKLEQPES